MHGQNLKLLTADFYQQRVGRKGHLEAYKMFPDDGSTGAERKPDNWLLGILSAPGLRVLRREIEQGRSQAHDLANNDMGAEGSSREVNPGGAQPSSSAARSWLPHYCSFVSATG